MDAARCQTRGRCQTCRRVVGRTQGRSPDRLHVVLSAVGYPGPGRVEVDTAFVAMSPGKGAEDAAEVDRALSATAVDHGELALACAVEKPAAIPREVGASPAAREVDSLAAQRDRSLLARTQQVHDLGAMRSVRGVAARGGEGTARPSGAAAIELEIPSARDLCRGSRVAASHEPSAPRTTSRRVSSSATSGPSGCSCRGRPGESAKPATAASRRSPA
jgi:hypothetical protein